MTGAGVEPAGPGNELRVALVHDWLTGMRGGERVLETLCRLFPRSEVFTLLHRPGSVSPVIESRPIHTSALNALPRVDRYYRWLLPLLPRAIESLRIEGFDLVISTSHCVAIGCRPPAATPHLCYCFSPMRYVWDQFDAYFRPDRSSLPARTAARLFAGRLRRWDRAASRQPDQVVAISNYVAERIGRAYGLETPVLYPGVDTEYFSSVRRSRRRIALMVSALVPYKNLDVALQAFGPLDLPLVVIGRGPSYKRLQRLAGPNVTFLGWQPDSVVRRYYAESEFLVFPSEEDFGLVPLEAMACGLPVLAYGRGGALETVMEGQTGLFFRELSAEGVRQGVERMLEQSFDPHQIRAHSLNYSNERFSEGMLRLVSDVRKR